MSEFSKVRPDHLKRQAWVYVRQSTMTQVREHTESLEAQYELVDRAALLGWKPDQVRVVDEDLGRSGAEASARPGFKSLVAAVGLGQVGLVLGKEVSRLARRNADWYHLLDLCALTDTLIADADGVYHPGDYNDRLVLGLKGTMSEAELHLLRSRLDAGLRHKAAKGELRQGLPVGLDYDPDDRVILSPDEAVREAIAVVFRRFAELGSARQVLLSMKADGLMLPRRSAGSSRIRWAEATYPAIHDFLTNPAYAGLLCSAVIGSIATSTTPATWSPHITKSLWRTGRSASPSIIAAIPTGTPIWPTGPRCGPTGAARSAKRPGRCAKDQPCCKAWCDAGAAGAR